MSTPLPPRVSVITPFYNGKEYLLECMESVLRQTHTNFEYLLIDNHSKDGASDLARELAARDPRVRVIQPPTFLPQVENYNFAIAQAAPDSAYVKVVAADDWLLPRCLSEMVALAHAHPRIAIVSSYRRLGKSVDGLGADPDRQVMSGRDACRLNLLDGVFLFGSPTTLLYRADVVAARKPFFALERLHPDTEAAFEILRDNDFGFVPQILTFSRTQAESEMGSRRAFDPAALDRLLMVEQFGPLYLSAEELRRAHTSASRWHNSVLARGALAQVIGRGSEDFWAYQRRGLANIGKQIEPVLVAAALARLAASSLLSPLQTARDLRKSLLARRKP